MKQDHLAAPCGQAVGGPEAAERAAFELWFSDGGKWPAAIERDRVGFYLLAGAASAWDTWQTARRAAPSPSSAAAMRQGVEALETAHTGLQWYRDTHPESVDVSDEEADAEILAAIASLRAALSAELEKTK